MPILQESSTVFKQWNFQPRPPYTTREVADRLRQNKCSIVEYSDGTGVVRLDDSYDVLADLERLPDPQKQLKHSISP